MLLSGIGWSDTYFGIWDLLSGIGCSDKYFGTCYCQALGALIYFLGSKHCKLPVILWHWVDTIEKGSVWSEDNLVNSTIQIFSSVK